MTNIYTSSPDFLHPMTLCVLQICLHNYAHTPKSTLYTPITLLQRFHPVAEDMPLQGIFSLCLDPFTDGAGWVLCKHPPDCVSWVLCKHPPVLAGCFISTHLTVLAGCFEGTHLTVLVGCLQRHIRGYTFTGYLASAETHSQTVLALCFVSTHLTVLAGCLQRQILGTLPIAGTHCCIAVSPYSASWVLTKTHTGYFILHRPYCCIAISPKSASWVLARPLQ